MEMKSFLRSLGEAKKYWVSLVVATCCSFMVAALWGANIGAFYPILEVTIRGKSVEQWFDEQLGLMELQLNERQVELAELQSQAASARGTAAQSAIERDLQRCLVDQSEIHQRLDRYRWARPWVERLVPNDPFQTIVMIVAILLGSTLIKHAFMVANDYLVGRAAVDITREMRNQLFSKAIHMDRATFSKHGAGSFQGQIAHTTDLLSSGLAATFGAAIREPLKLLACLLGAAIICPRLLLLSLIVAPVLGGLLIWITRKIRKNTRRMLSRVMGFHGLMVESLGNVQTVQAYQMETHEDKRFADATWATRRYRLSCILLASATKPVIEFLGVGMLGVTILAGAHLVLNRQTHLLGIPICSEPLSVSALLIFFGMLIGASDPLRRLSAVYWQIYSGMVAADTIYGVLDQPSMIHEPERPVALPKRHRILSLKGVHFGYNPEHTILQGVDLEIPFGSTIAVVGHNGSGKSTLIHLLCRFYDPQAGGVHLDDIDYRELRLSDIRSRIALVNQHTELFNETVAYNIRYGTLDATDEQVEQAARQSHAAEFIERDLENAYQTVVGTNGNRLSGGQRQRIALARALLRDPEILILDEATSQIDMQSEQLIRQSLAEHRGKRTMIIITHREKLLELADDIYEVKEGQLIRTTREKLQPSSLRDVA